MLFHRRPISHFIAINAWAVARGGDARLDLRTFQITITANNRHYEFTPQFIVRHDDRIRYRPSFAADVEGFAGWLPYFNRRWDAGVDKLAFKRAADSLGLRTPKHWHSNRPDAPFIIKHATGSFADGLRGPWRTYAEADAAQQLKSGEFYEALVAGSIIKLWAFGPTLVCVERREPPLVVGDGRHTVAELADRHFDLNRPGRRADFERRKNDMRTLLAFQGVDWDFVLPDGGPLCLDFIYGSPLFPSDDQQNRNLVGSIEEATLLTEIEQALPRLHVMLPPQWQAHTLYSVDGVLDQDGRVFWLEMNCNPMVPPDAYGVILDHTFFGPTPQSAVIPLPRT